ncbi:hypothetical protein [Lyngbya confervoides]|uniref:Uncharacterized protein n=1 Tax=Lyngbya confervoides BDU141951 TaxID=1574623 RepID=A0ABD4T142_9CYAN|nr:hypothetical protein [Lyngbya confervoides]MCM1982297.1 hypothetical protein [Lyngbya confervoides BDU141951]
MLVILTKNQVLSTDTVCQGCLLADQRGHPRWQNGHLCCGQQVPREASDAKKRTDSCLQYRCQMGFRVAQIS